MCEAEHRYFIWWYLTVVLAMAREFAIVYSVTHVSYQELPLKAQQGKVVYRYS